MTKQLHVPMLVVLAACAAASLSATSRAPRSLLRPSASAPVIDRVTPDAPAPTETAQRLRFDGRDFQPALALEVIDPSGQTTVLSGDDILDFEPTTFAAMLRLAQPGPYSLTVRNPDGGVSVPYVLQVAESAPAPLAPVITGTTPAEPQSLPRAQDINVTGRHFAPGLRAVVTDEAGQQLSNVEVSAVTPESFLLTVRLAQPGTYALVASNPSGEMSAAWHLTVR